MTNDVHKRFRERFTKKGGKYNANTYLAAGPSDILAFIDEELNKNTHEAYELGWEHGQEHERSSLAAKIEGRVEELRAEIRRQEDDEGLADPHTQTRYYEALKLRDDLLRPQSGIPEETECCEKCWEPIEQCKPRTGDCPWCKANGKPKSCSWCSREEIVMPQITPPGMAGNLRTEEPNDMMAELHDEIEKTEKEGASFPGRLRVAFDIDDTLLVPSVVMGNGVSGDNVPHYEVIAVLKWFQSQGAEIILWSGSGMDWAKRWGEKFGLEPFTVRMKEKSADVDIAFDDCDVNLAKVNVKVRRIKNSISRAEWNSDKSRPKENPSPQSREQGGEKIKWPKMPGPITPPLPKYNREVS